MPVTQIDNWKDRILELLLSQFEDADLFSALISSCVAAGQDTEDLIIEVIQGWFEDNLSGDRLDTLGDIVGVQRDGLTTDAAYFNFIKARIMVLKSSGCLPSVIDVFRALTGATDIMYQSLYPAAYGLTYTVPSALGADVIARLKKWMEPEVTASGVGLEFIVEVATTTPFTLAAHSSTLSTPVTGNNLGLSEVSGTVPLTGGELVKTI